MCVCVIYLHVPPFEDGGQDGTKTETGNFIQGIHQLQEREREAGTVESGDTVGKGEGGGGELYT